MTLSTRNSYLAFAVALCSFALLAFVWSHYRKPKELNTIGRNIPVSGIPAYATAPVSRINFPKVPSLPKDEISSSNYETVTDVNLFPGVLKQLYGIGNNGPFSGMSNPGGPFNGFDVTTDDKIPRMRLVFAAVSRAENLWIIHYEFGGYTHGYNVAFLTASATSAQPVWLCRLNQPAGDVRILLRTVRGGTCTVP